MVPIMKNIAIKTPSHETPQKKTLWDLEFLCFSGETAVFIEIF